jgi:hypothetical protein
MQDIIKTQIDKTNLILARERKNKMSMPLQGDSQADFERDITESLMESHSGDPIIEATKNQRKDPMEETFPKFQYSIFVDAQRNAQIVIRANSFEEFKKLKAEADSILTFTTTSANPMAQQTVAPAAPKPVSNAPICGVHNVPMQWKEGTSSRTGKPYAFWSCSQRMPDGSYCQYKASI